MLRVVRPALAPLLLAAVLSGTAVVVLGQPDPLSAARFFNAAFPSLGDGLAVARLVCWVIVAVVVCTLLVHVVLVGRRTGVRPSSALRIAVWLVAGTMLGIAIARHIDAGGGCCAGAANQVQVVMQLAH